MALKRGDNVFVRLMPEYTLFSATVEELSDDHFLLRFNDEEISKIASGKYVVISDGESDCYTQIDNSDGKVVRLKRMWSDRREFFRVDDIFPVSFSVVDKDIPYIKSKIVSGFSQMTVDTELPDETVNPHLWKMLVDINTKLNLLIEGIELEREGFRKAKNSRVNLSATGMRFTSKEKATVGDTLEIKMLLPLYPPVGILVYGVVVRVLTNDSGEHEIAVHFTDMDEEIRDEIIQYALKRQRDMIRSQRQTLEGK